MKTKRSIGTINKKWAGVAKELFTTADKYKVNIDPAYKEDYRKVAIIVAAITVDMVLKGSESKDGNKNEKVRCGWCGVQIAVYIAYHDEEWGRTNSR
jgi:hypothetical protein